jgi:hypothetical protein
MEIPTLPTDNLYKFVTVLGLIAAVFFFYVAYERKKEVTDLTYDYLIKQIELHQDFARAVTRAGGDAKLLDEVHFWEQQNDMVMGGVKKLGEIKSLEFPTVGWYIALAVGSAAIGIGGVLLWYFKFQRHMDRLISSAKKLPEA